LPPSNGIGGSIPAAVAMSMKEGFEFTESARASSFVTGGVVDQCHGRSDSSFDDFLDTGVLRLFPAI
jgi:hypothetical protein